MPYIISKLKSGLYEVKLADTGRILSKGTTLSKAKKQIKLIAMLEHIKGSGLHQNENNIQSVLFHKDDYTQKQADKWLKEHGFKVDKSTYNFDSKNYFRYRQHTPDMEKYNYRMHEIEPDHKIVFVLEYEKPKKLKGGGLKASTLKGLLQSGYKMPGEQKKELDGFIRDDSLSGRRSQVYYNPDNNEAVISHRGTEGSLKDWSNNLAYATGLYKYTDRYKHAKDAQQKAEQKYGKNLTTIGHSQGAMLAGDVGKNSKQIISVDRPAKMSEVLFGKTGKNHQDIRTNNDLVSSMIPFQRKANKAITIKTNANPIAAHDLGHLDKLGEQEIGGKMKHHKKTSAWIEFVKSYAKQHNVKYNEALIKAKHLYRK